MTTIKITKSHLAGIAVLLWPMAVGAAPILDQESVPLDPEALGFNVAPSIFEWQQGVTAGVEGQLSGIEMYFFGSAAAGTFEVWLGSPWQSGASVFSMAYSGASSWTLFDVSSAGLTLGIGDTFTFGVIGDDTLGQFASACATVEACAYSTPAYLGFPFVTGTPVDGQNFTFRTYMEVEDGPPPPPPPPPPPVGVPEPATLALLGLGLAGMGFSRRRKR